MPAPSRPHATQSRDIRPRESLPPDRLEIVQGFGQSSRSVGYVYRPSGLEDLEEVFYVARRSGRTIGLRGAGRSYGDAAQNNEEIVVDTSRLRRVIEWDPRSGVVTVEPGVTIEDLWSTVLPDGWWPPVVPGTMFPTIGGCVAMNVHGKNNFRAGPFGDHVLSFDFLAPTGDRVSVSRTSDPELFHAAIGGFGMLGCFLSIRLQMKRVHSGLLDVVGLSTPGLDDSIARFAEHCEHADYMVGWIDAFASGTASGRGVLHYARHLDPGIDPSPVKTLSRESQHVPNVLFGVVPTSIMWVLLRPLMNNLGMRTINALRYRSGRVFDGSARGFRQSLVAFSFLLDYIPEWRRAYGNHGFIQFQSFIPAATASDVLREQLRLARAARHPAYLAVLKRHRKDGYLMSHGVDGYSLAMDFPLARNRHEVVSVSRRLAEVALQAGGRFYFAKDSTLTPETARASIGSDVLTKFRTLRKKYDPDGILRTDLYDRLFNDCAY